MVSVIHGEVVTVLDANRNSICCSVEDTTKETETTTSTTSPQTSDSNTVDNSEGTSRTSEPQNEIESHDSPPQSSRQESNEQHPSVSQRTCSPPVCGARVQILQATCRDAVRPSERTQRSYVNVKSTSGSVASLESTNFRRPDVSYASAVTRSTTRTISQEDKTTTNTTNTLESDQSEKSATTSASSHQRRKLSKQMTVDESWATPIFIGASDDDYFENVPSSCSSQFCKPSAETNRRMSVDIINAKNEMVEPIDRPQSLPSTELPSDPTPPESTKSDLKPAPELPNDTEPDVPVSTASVKVKSSLSLQPISVNLPDAEEINDLRPVRELLPERSPGAPTVVRVENHPYAGVVPSRARQLVRSMAMCGDDDTRLRPPPPPSMMKSYASVAAVGVSPLSRHRNSSSLSRESSYTDYATDLNDMELRAFITATLHKNPRDRTLILQLEQLFTDFLSNFGQQSMKLAPASSYNRMIIHRLAVVFGLDHNVDNSGKCVVVSKTSKSKRPPYLFATLIQSNLYTDTRKFYNGVWDYGEGDRRALSFDTGYLTPQVEYESMYQPLPWNLRNHRSFEHQQQFYPMGYVDHGPTMRKAGSFSGVPAFYRSSSSADGYDRLQNINGHAHSLASSTHMSPREPIDEAAERLNNFSFSDRASQMSYRSSGSNQPHPPSGLYVGYPPVVQYQMSDDMTYAPYQQQPIYVQPAPVMASSSTEMYTPQPTIMMPVQQNPPLQPSTSMIPCQQPQDSMTNGAQGMQDPATVHLMPVQQPEYVHYTTSQYPTQMIGCPPQAYQPVPQTVYPTQYQQVVYPQPYEPVIRQPMVQVAPTVMPTPQPQLVPSQQYPAPQQYPTPIYHSPVQPQPYQPAVFHSQMPQQQHHIMGQPVVHVQSPVYQQMTRPAMVQAVPQPQQQQCIEVPNAVPQTTMPSYHPTANYAQWSTGVPYNEEINEVEESSEVTGPESETRTTVVPMNMMGARMNHGKPMMNPLSVLVHTEPMYHYSQTSPVMSSMQQQQMMQLHGQSRPLLYKAAEQNSGTQNSVDGGYCSMTQESIRDGELVTDAQ
nr:Single-stranded nucleic acid binding R3H domain containing protein [Haemonchus contortus]